MFSLLSVFEVMIYEEHFTSGGLRVASTIPDMRDISHNCQKVFVIIVKKYISVIIVITRVFAAFRHWTQVHARPGQASMFFCSVYRLKCSD